MGTLFLWHVTLIIALNSAIERAEKLVTKWEKILEEHKKNLPEAVPQVETQLALARTERDALISAGPTNNDSEA